MFEWQSVGTELIRKTSFSPPETYLQSSLKDIMVTSGVAGR